MKKIGILTAVFAVMAWAQTAELSGLYTLNFRINDAQGEPLMICGGDARAEFADAFTPAKGVMCTAFRGVAFVPAQEKPADCLLSWQGFFVLPAQGKPEIRWQCAGDTPFAAENVSFAVGDKVKGDGWMCRREEDGLTCVNDQGFSFAVNSRRYILIDGQ